jgi:hypothetical protein
VKDCSDEEVSEIKDWDIEKSNLIFKTSITESLTSKCNVLFDYINLPEKYFQGHKLCLMYRDQNLNMNVLLNN